MEHPARGSRVRGDSVGLIRLEDLAGESFCYVTTRGRRTGKPHEIEIWFVVHDGDLFLMSGGGDRSDWVRNMLAAPEVTVRLGPSIFQGTAEVAPADVAERQIRESMAAKYQSWEPGQRLSRWASEALVVRIRARGPGAFP